MAPTDFSEAVKEYYNSKSEYITLIQAASAELERREAAGEESSATKRDSSNPVSSSQVEGKDRSEAIEPDLEIPDMPRLKDTSGMTPRRAAELIAEMRNSVEKGNKKELKELLGKFDRGMGFQTTTSSKSR